MWDYSLHVTWRRGRVAALPPDHYMTGWWENKPQVPWLLLLPLPAFLTMFPHSIGFRKHYLPIEEGAHLQSAKSLSLRKSRWEEGLLL